MGAGIGSDATQEGTHVEPDTETTNAIAELRARLESLEAERDILRRLHAYGPALDYGQEAAFVECFVKDGVFALTGHPFHTRFEGSEQLAAFAAQHTRAPGHVHKHCVFDSVINVRGSRATSVSYFTRLDLEPDGPVVHAFGRYHDRLAKGRDGIWRFVQRTCEIEAFS